MTPAQIRDDTSAELLELTADYYAADSSDIAKQHVELIAGSRPSSISATTSLLHVRLRAVTILLLLVFSMILVWALFNRGAVTWNVYLNVAIVRLVILAATLAILSSGQKFSQYFLRGVEYSLFGILTLLWTFFHYRTVLMRAHSGNSAELMLDGRTSVIGLFLLMVVHGIFIPHRWQGTARVVLTMALVPALVSIVIDVRHPQLAQGVAELLSWHYVSTNLLIVCVGAVLATYTSHVLHNLRKDVRDAKKFGQYQLLNKLGSGGMGDVYLAEHVLMKRPCALKLIRDEASADPTALARFEREVKTTASLTHPHTIEIYDYGHTDGGTFYYVMEYLPGLSLDRLLSDYGPLPSGRVIYLLRQACSALAEAHTAGLIHRDLKPGNLLISERGGLCDFVKVLDFGLVKHIQPSGEAQLTADHVISGTPLYMSPEQARVDKDVDGRSDLYALGAIAYHMLTGVPPFQEENVMAVLVAHAHQQVSPISNYRSDVSEDLQRVVLRSLEKSPVERYADANEMEQALAACSDAGDWDARKAAMWWHDVCFTTTECTTRKS